MRSYSRVALIATAVAFCWGAAGYAQSGEMVRASDPEGIVAVLVNSGYDATIDKDELGDPMIRMDLSGRSVRLLFYGCDETTHDNCQSLQFSAGFDREQPWTPDEAIKLSDEYRYMAVRLDDENDPYIHWDVEIGEGIPQSVFLRTVLRFTESVETAIDIIFAD